MGGWLALKLPAKTSRCSKDRIDQIDFVIGYANGPAVIGNGPGNGLANPIGRIGAELDSEAIVKLIGCSDQPDIALLNQIRKRQPAFDVPSGDRYDQAQI